LHRIQVLRGHPDSVDSALRARDPDTIEEPTDWASVHHSLILFKRDLGNLLRSDVISTIMYFAARANLNPVTVLPHVDVLPFYC
jgi:hypothetical protein